MMTFLDQATRRRAVQSFFLLLLLSFSSDALASNSPVINSKSRRCSPDGKVHGRTERKLAAVPAPGPAVAGSPPAPSSSNPRPPPPLPNSEPAVLSPSDDTAGPDLPPIILSPPPASEVPVTSPIPSPILASKQSNVAVILGVTGGVLVILVVSLSVVAYLKPEWLPCCQPRSSQLIQYERHVPI